MRFSGSPTRAAAGAARRSAPGTLALLIAASIAGCGDDPPGAPDQAGAFRRVALTSGAPDVEEPRVRCELRAAEGDMPWSPTAERTEVREIRTGAEDGSTTAATILAGEGALKYVRGALPAGTEAFDTVVVEAATFGRGSERIRVYLYRDGELATPPRIQDMGGTEDVQLFTFRFPAMRGAAEAPDEFGIAFEGKTAEAAVVSVTFIDMPSATFAPPLDGEGEMVRIGETLERAVGLLPGHDVTGSLTIAATEQLRLAVAAHPRLHRGGEVLTFEVELQCAKGRQTRTVECPDGTSWNELLLSAADLGTGPVELRVRMTSSLDDDGIGLVTIPTVRRLAPDAPGPAPRTVLLITSDTHRADHLGILGPDAPVSTPHLDALARRGVLFTNCVAQTNITNPSHIALMTGMHPRDVGVLTNFDRLSQSASTLAEAFRAAGYETVAAVSAPQLVGKSGLGQGFDRVNAPGRGQRPGTVAIDLVCDWLDAAGSADVFAWLHLYDAHAPYSPPAPYNKRYYGKRDPRKGEPLPLDDRVIPGWAKKIRDIDYPYAQYRAEVDYVDGSLAKILEHPRAARSTIAFTADHGELFGEHGVWWSHAGLYPGILRIPLILSYPGARQGTRTDVPVNLTDVGATLLDLAELPRATQGRNLLELIQSPPAPEPRYSLAAHHHSASVESDGWFLTLELNTHFGPTLERERHLGEVELYHLTEDPGCTEDVLLDHLDRAKRLRSALIAWLDAAPAERLSEGQERTESDVAMLAALGYGGGGQSEAAARYWNPEARLGPDWQLSPWRRLFEDEDFGLDDFRAAMGRD